MIGWHTSLGFAHPFWRNPGSTTGLDIPHSKIACGGNKQVILRAAGPVGYGHLKKVTKHSYQRCPYGFHVSWSPRLDPLLCKAFFFGRHLFTHPMSIVKAWPLRPFPDLLLSMLLMVFAVLNNQEVADQNNRSVSRIIRRGATILEHQPWKKSEKYPRNQNKIGR